MKIDFHVTNCASGTALNLFACRLIEKLYQANERIFIYAEDKKQAEQFDELLWTYREDSFLPHNLIGEGPLQTPPIQIGYADAFPVEKHILLNLNSIIPICHNEFKRIIELVPTDENLQTIARDHYRQYRAEGFTINTHKLTAEEV